MKSSVKLSVLFSNLGPYHVARLTALAEQCTVLPIEISESSREYRWGNGGYGTIKKVTLLSSSEARSVGRAVVRDRLVMQLQKFSPDVVVVPGWYEPTSLAAIEWACAADVPVVIMSESTRQDERRYPHREFVKRQIIRLCAAAIVGGRPHAAYMRELGMEPSCIIDGYDVVDNEHFAIGAATARRECLSRRRDYHLPDEYFLVSSRFLPRKNLLRLIAAYARYRQHVKRSLAWSLIILGYGPQEQELRTEIERRGLQRWISIHGFQPYDRLPTYYGLAGAFLHPALREPWGLVVNEAMATGLVPLVSRTAGCAADLVTDGETGFQFDPEDIQQLSTLMVRVSSDSELRMYLSKRAEERIREWSPRRFGTNLSTISKRVLSQKLEPPPLLSRLCLQALLPRAS